MFAKRLIAWSRAMFAHDGSIFVWTMFAKLAFRKVHALVRAMFEFQRGNKKNGIDGHVFVGIDDFDKIAVHNHVSFLVEELEIVPKLICG